MVRNKFVNKEKEEILPIEIRIKMERFRISIQGVVIYARKWRPTFVIPHS